MTAIPAHLSALYAFRRVISAFDRQLRLGEGFVGFRIDDVAVKANLNMAKSVVRSLCDGIERVCLFHPPCRVRLRTPHSSVRHASSSTSCRVAGSVCGESFLTSTWERKQTTEYRYQATASPDAFTVGARREVSRDLVLGLPLPYTLVLDAEDDKVFRSDRPDVVRVSYGKRAAFGIAGVGGVQGSIRRWRVGVAVGL